MCTRWLITCMFLLLVNKVSLEKPIIAVEGGTIILPCLYSGAPLQRDEMNVFWRHNDKRKVHNIVKGEVSVVEQDPAYQNRTESFPKEFAKGNFSIKLSRVTSSDNGAYSCHMLFESDVQSIQLQVERAAPQPTPRPGNKAMEVRSILSSLVFAVLLGYFFFI
ncbi:CD276 antigen-like [Salminus brasiliensis]|uniref:CD276 antigen-like n=1 Tax=Salminus brasiliensis TaxID=930266 RepID=UPI003B833C70